MAHGVNLDEVAQRAGVSRASASRALNGRPGVRDDVRERVRAVATELGYRPNRAARNLAGGRTSVLGFLMGADDFLENPYSHALLQAMARAADRQDEGLMILLDGGEPNRAVRNLLDDGLVEGVIVSVMALGAGWVEELLDANLPAVLVGAHPGRDDVAVVDTEGVQSTAALVEHLWSRGAERVAFVEGRVGRVDAEQRRAGFVLAHERRGRPLDAELIVPGDFTRASGRAAVDRLLEKRADAILAANDESAFGIQERLTELEVDVPGELLLAGFDGLPTPYGFDVLTTAEQPFDELASRAVRTLVRMIDAEEPPRRQLVEPRLRFAATTAR